MTLKCIVNGSNMEDISCVSINDCYAIYFRIHEVNRKIMLYRKEDELNHALMLSGTIPIFVEPVTTTSDDMKEYLGLNRDYLQIVSTSKEFLAELFISYPTIDLGLLETSGKYLDVTEDDYYISFIILKHADDCGQRIKELREKNSTLRIYISCVAHTCTEYEIRQYIRWKPDGIIVDPHRVEKINKLVSLYTK